MGRVLKRAFSYGHYSVAVFIVLSGFCLALPVALSPDRQLRGGFGRYIRRRALRILPPYFAALFLFIALIAVTPLLQTPAGTAWDSKIPMTKGAVLSHVALIHNVIPGLNYRIDGPMWSVATEWQI
jgi:peptidoglycan/LPS O-acetylase OafA/YrhL